MIGSLHRRSVLRLSGATAFSSLAGCVATKGELGLRTEQLGKVVLANSVNEPFEVDVEVIRAGTTVHESSHYHSPGSSEERPQVVLDEWAEESEARS